MTTDSIGYDPSLERIDVAIRAVVKLSRGGRKLYCDQIGLTPDHRKLVRAAVEDLDDWRSEENLFHLIRSCPFVVGFALELLRLYAVRSKVYRQWYYSRQGGRRDVANVS